MATPHRIFNRDRRTLEAIFRHPVPRNLARSDALHLIERLGTARQEPNGRLLFTIGEQRHVFPQSHDKELTAEEVAQLRKFLEGAGVTPATVDVVEEDRPAASTTRDMLVAVDHHRARVRGLEERDIAQERPQAASVAAPEDRDERGALVMARGQCPDGLVGDDFPALAAVGATEKLRPTGCPGVGYGSWPTISTRTSANGCLKARSTSSPAGR